MKNNLTHDIWIFEKNGDYFSERQDDFKPIKTANDSDVVIVDAIKLDEFNLDVEPRLDQIVMNAFDKDIEEVRQEISKAFEQEKEKVEV